MKIGIWGTIGKQTGGGPGSGRHEDGRLLQETRTFGTCGRPRQALCAWLRKNRIELVVMESTGIYWKSVYAALEAAGLKAYVANARQ